MNAIKKQLQMLKLEKDLAMDKADLCDQQAKEANRREEKLRDEVRELAKKLMQMEHDLKVSKAQLIKSNKDLEMKERIYIVTQSELAVLNRKMQQCMQNLEKSEERRLSAQMKLTQAMETAEDAKRICKVLENRSKQDEERMDQLMTQLKEARLIAEDADTKSDDISRKLAFVEDELEAAEERVKSSEAKILEREDELFIVGNILKSLEVSEEKANQRVEEFKAQLKELKVKLKAAEKRAIIAEKTVKIFTKEMDKREDYLSKEKEKYKFICDDLDSTFSELTGY
ncbi:Tropomyosin-2 [Camponotus floridanus]|uniref:Tropomyosin-2 n=1 Tax=Camponotus floridanus TaxID=104421 RepID=E1ZVU9_CAMFO|nr:tropomyosin-2 [Camponotus floridanus]XP_025262425.1 tropomyosin-2 [Camponotus floridanus]EFN74685.1 Tropomyosin-2 [Camponotus floridanus]